MDNLTKEQRLKNMRAIQSSGTKIEILVCKALWRNGVRYRKNVKNLPGKPDVAIKKYKIAIFLDSCFWHKCPIHFKQPKSNQDYWDKKIQRNVEHDKKINEYYSANGWHILRIWEHQLKRKEEQAQTINEIIDFVNSVKKIDKVN